MRNIQELILLFVKLILFKLVSSIVSVHSSINLSTNFFLHLQFLQSKYSPKSHDLLHSHLRLLGFQIYSLSHIPSSINSLHSYRHLSLFERCLLLQTLAFYPHLHQHFPCHFICLVLLVLEIRLNTLIFKSFTKSGTHIFAYGSLTLLQPPLHLLVLILKG